MNFILHIWRQVDSKSKGYFKTYSIDNINEDDSFLEMLDKLNQRLIDKKRRLYSF